MVITIAEYGRVTTPSMMTRWLFSTRMARHLTLFSFVQKLWSYIFFHETNTFIWMRTIILRQYNHPPRYNLFLLATPERYRNNKPTATRKE